MVVYGEAFTFHQVALVDDARDVTRVEVIADAVLVRVQTKMGGGGARVVEGALLRGTSGVKKVRGGERVIGISLRGVEVGVR